jgi:hypothetical protein
MVQEVQTVQGVQGFRRFKGSGGSVFRRLSVQKAQFIGGVYSGTSGGDSR